ncbi:carbohydrate ABC transporter permease [Treponema sp. OttesenSCG-928-L16]|nr:carbohydrate ABC transporter permease [Treponema sp. OttesenSCG-928-L16]
MMVEKTNVVYKTLFYVLALSFLVLFGFPFVLTFMMSFKSQAEYMSGNYWGLPKKLFFGNYQKVFLSNFRVYFLNSIIVASVTVFLTVMIASLASYALAKIRFKLAGPLLLMFIVGMMIPVHTTLIPIYQMTKAIRLTDRLAGLIGPYISFGLPVAIYIMTTFFREVSDSIQESALIDGASALRIYWNIMLPISTPAISTVAIYNFLTYWNEFIYAMTLINSSFRKTLPVGMREFYGAESINIPAVLTAVLVGSLPVILFYMFAQEKVINGLSAGAVKG